jgi:transposase
LKCGGTAAPHRPLHSFEIQRKTAIPRVAILYKQRHNIESMFGRLKDWRRIKYPIRPLRPHLFVGVCVAAAVAFWL